MSSRFSNSDYAKIKVLIVAKLLQHEEPIYAGDIADYINEHRFGITAEVTPQDIAHTIQKYSASRYYMNQIKILKYYDSKRHAYIIKEKEA